MLRRFYAIMGLTRFLAKRAVFLVLTLVLSMYLVVMIANGGGIIDDFLKASTRFDLNQRLRNDPAYRRLSPENQTIVFNNLYNASLEARGLNEPFLQKSLRYTFDALTLRLGRALEITDSAGSSEVYDIIAERLPRTILLFTTASIISAVFGIWLGLRMARKALSAFDRGMTVISIATVVVPPWVYGILFILIFAYGMDIFPAQGWISVPAPVPGTFGYYTDILWHLALPLAADRHIPRLDPDCLVDGRHHHGNGLQLARSRPALLPSHPEVRPARDCRLDGRVRGPPRNHGLPPGPRVRSA